MRFRRKFRAQDLLDYVLIAGFISVVSAVTIPGVSLKVSTIVRHIGSLISISTSPS